MLSWSSTPRLSDLICLRTEFGYVTAGLTNANGPDTTKVPEPSFRMDERLSPAWKGCALDEPRKARSFLS